MIFMYPRMKDYFQCSHSCGHGVQTRTVTCHRVNMYSWVDPETTDITRCINSQMPLEVRSCRLPRCDSSVFWEAGEWSECKWSSQCGARGKQRRSVHCINKEGRNVSRKKCKKEHGVKLRPHRKRKCEKKMCGWRSCEDVRQVGLIGLNVSYC